MRASAICLLFGASLFGGPVLQYSLADSSGTFGGKPFSITGASGTFEFGGWQTASRLEFGTLTFEFPDCAQPTCHESTTFASVLTIGGEDYPITGNLNAWRPAWGSNYSWWQWNLIMYGTNGTRFVNAVGATVQAQAVIWEYTLAQEPGIHSAFFGRISDPVPEPSTLALIGLPLAACALAAGRRQRAA